MAAITISRQYGSGGRKVALRLSQILGWTLFDKRLLMQVASDVGLSSDDVVDFTEYDYKVESFWDRLFGGGVVSDPSGGYIPAGTLTSDQMDQEGSVRLVNKAIQSAYERGDVIIVGRGGQVLLQDKPDVLHVRVQASMEMRKVRLETYEEVKVEDTESIALARDKAAEQYMKRFFNVKWDDPTLYHLVINSEKLDIDTIAQLIATAAQQLLPVAQS